MVAVTPFSQFSEYRSELNIKSGKMQYNFLFKSKLGSTIITMSSEMTAIMFHCRNIVGAKLYLILDVLYANIFRNKLTYESVFINEG